MTIGESMNTPGQPLPETAGAYATSSTVVYELGKITSHLEVCEGQVRWNAGKLEQLWSVMGIGTTGAIETIKKEWRAVEIIP